MQATLASGGAFTPDEAQVIWRHPTMRQFGEAQLTVRSDNPAWDEVSTWRNGGCRLTLNDAAAGLWDGVVTKVDLDARTATLSALDSSVLLAGLPAPVFPLDSTVTAGALAYRLLRAALPGLHGSWLMPGKFVEAAPIPSSVSFGGKMVLDILNDLAAQTGQEWFIQGQFINWQPATGRLIPTILAEGEQVSNVQLTTSRDRTVEMIGRSSKGQETRLRTGEDVGYNGRQEAIQVSDEPATAMRQVRAALMSRRRPQHSFQLDILRTMLVPNPTGGLSRRSGWGYNFGYHWGGEIISAISVAATDLDLGDWVSLIIPSVGKAGISCLARVLEKSVSQASDKVTLRALDVGLPTGTIWPKFLDQSSATLPPAELARVLSVWSEVWPGVA